MLSPYMRVTCNIEPGKEQEQCNIALVCCHNGHMRETPELQSCGERKLFDTVKKYRVCNS